MEMSPQRPYVLEPFDIPCLLTAQITLNRERLNALADGGLLIGGKRRNFQGRIYRELTENCPRTRTTDAMHFSQSNG